MEQNWVPRNTRVVWDANIKIRIKPGCKLEMGMQIGEHTAVPHSSSGTQKVKRPFLRFDSIIDNILRIRMIKIY